MFLRIVPVYRKVWAEALEQYLDSTHRIGYRAESLDGKVLAFGKTRTEAFIDGLEILAKTQVRSLSVRCICDSDSSGAMVLA